MDLLQQLALVRIRLSEIAVIGDELEQRDAIKDLKFHVAMIEKYVRDHNLK